ncbi:MAG: SUMF1/EgtB/PvdO family nonheme iron enzyme [Verrucomicrobia bacterium]|nr:SUMF1/EgtB/PvdO family nonheme iron enzyme [Verrucomicrobiota bacterium]
MTKRMLMMVAFAAGVTGLGALAAAATLPPKFRFDPNSKGLARGEGDRWRDLRREFAAINVDALARAIDNLASTFPKTYEVATHRAALDAFKARQGELKTILDGGEQAKLAEAEALLKGVRMALLANPLLDDAQILMVRRPRGNGFISLNSHCHVSIARGGFDDSLIVLSNLRDQARLDPFFKPNGDLMVRDVEPDFSADRMLFSSMDEKRKWAVFEIKVDGTGLRQVSPKDYPDVDWFDGCYLPDGRIILLSTASYQALPCENGSRPMAQTYLSDPVSGQVRQLTFEQDSDYTPSINNDGRVLYTRWEYSDLMHYYSRILMTMNPDGTSQFSEYGSGSYYPTALLQVRAIPGSKQKVVGIVSGHHDVAEYGRLVIFDPYLARKYPFKYQPPAKDWGAAGSFLRINTEVLPAAETGCVAEIPGWGKAVVGDVCDQQTGNQYDLGRPLFVHPWPLNENFYLVSAKPKNVERWGIYLVDTFDNMTLLAEDPAASLFEPVVLQARPRPPVIPDRITPGVKTASVHIANIYVGPGLKEVPVGAVKALRLFAYHFNYVGTGGHESLGVEAGWDIKRILGTVPVEADGSACFEIPANTPISIQPLDADGAALQLMRSWLVGMPNERVSCVGCHEDNRSSVPMSRTMADTRPMSRIAPWYGEPRPFGFEHEVLPVLQKNCLGCHDGAARPAKLQPPIMGNGYNLLHPYVRRPGPESEMEVLPPLEYHVSTSPLIQMLKKGHHGVNLDREGWDRLYAWIDLNAPFKGKWSPGDFEGRKQKDRRLELAMVFANNEVSPEDEYDHMEQQLKTRPKPEYVTPAAVVPVASGNLSVPGFPLTTEQAKLLQGAPGETRKRVQLPDGTGIAFVRIPAGSLVMGSSNGFADESPEAVVKIGQPFWMSECEIRNAEYAKFDPAHDTRYIDQHGKDHNFPGYIANHAEQPVARVTWRRAMDFCAWLSKTTRLKVNLPTEAQWEWAARAGTAGDAFYGSRNDDFSKHANLAGREVRWNKVGFEGGPIIMHRNPYPPEMNFPLHDERFEDRWFIVDFVAQYAANPWGLQDMIGNVSEWTRSSYQPYPYADDDGRNNGDAKVRKVARGGSWASRPVDARSAIRLPYETFQPVHDVGIRLVIEE